MTYSKSAFLVDYQEQTITARRENVVLQRNGTEISVHDVTGLIAR